MSNNNVNQQLHDLLVTRNFEPQTLDESGKPASSPNEADLFSFDYTADSGKDYGTVVIMLGDDNNVTVYSGDNIGKAMEGDDKKGWFDFLYELKQLSTKNLKSFSVQDLNKLKYSMKGQAAIREGLFEAWQGHKNISWNAAPTEARLMIRHKRVIGENEARYRHIESLFLETAEGERYKLPFTKLSGGRAMLEHVRQGGKPYDVRGQHIATIVSEMNLLSRFKKASQGKIFEDETAKLITEAGIYYETLHKNLKSIGTKNGYASYFEAWDPAAITDEDVIIEDLRHMFVEKNIDSRIEQALPLLAKLKQQETVMKEADIFESWANLITEGTWALPDTPEKQTALIDFLSREQPVGPDATDATEQLYDIFGDDELFNRLETLSTEDANADARKIVLDRLEELKDNHDIAQVIGKLKIEKTPSADQDSELTEEDLNEYIEDMADYRAVMRLAAQYQNNAATLGRLAQEAGQDSQEQRAWEYLRSRKYRNPAKNQTNDANWNEIVRTISQNSLEQEGGLLNAVYRKMKEQGYGKTPEQQQIMKNVLSDEATQAKIEAAWKNKLEKSVNMGEDAISQLRKDAGLSETSSDFELEEGLGKWARNAAVAGALGLGAMSGAHAGGVSITPDGQPDPSGFTAQQQQTMNQQISQQKKPFGVNFNPEYLKQAASGARGRFMISQNDAKIALDWLAQHPEYEIPLPVKEGNPTGAAAGALGAAMTKNNIMSGALKGWNSDFKMESTLSESARSEIDIMLQEIARGNIDIFDIYYSPKSNAEKFVANQIEEKIPAIARENGLDPKTDIKDILQRIQRELEVEYGVDDNTNIEMDEDDFGKTVGTMAGMALAPEVPGSGMIGGMIGDRLTSETVGRGNFLEENTALQGQYGHSGKMEPVVAKDEDMLMRIRALAGIRESETEVSTDNIELTRMKELSSIFIR